MIRITFTEENIHQLQVLQQTHQHSLVRRKAHVLLLKSQNISHYKIAKITGVCENTVRTYLRAYQRGGIEELKIINFHQPQPRLKPFDAQVRDYLETTPPATISQACSDIAKLTDVSIKTTQMRAYLKSIKASYRKVNSIPAKVNIEAQQAFHDEQLQPKLQEAKEGKRNIYFVDAAHFVLGAFLGYLWSFVRIYVRTPSGRQRFNVLGALNAITKELVTITNDSYITSIQVCELLRKLTENTTLPITLILDNARYQRCKLVMELATKLNIELLFLPPYSPNLNLIERLWKLVKKECLNSKYYDNFSAFKGSIETFLSTMNTTHPEKLESLLTPKFQMFTEEEIRLAA